MTMLRATRCTFHSEPLASTERIRERTLRGAVFDRLTLAPPKFCDCGCPTTHIAVFRQLTSQGHPTLNASPLCAQCAEDFYNPEQLLTLQEAYHVAQVKLPKWTAQSVAAGESASPRPVR